jgi:acid phosphatase family membrane protein YuiD
MSFGYAGNQNTFVATTELSGNLMVAFGRNKLLPVNRYVRITPVKKTTGLYHYFNPLDYARFSHGTEQFDWPAGSPAPTGFTNSLGWELRSFTTRRKVYPFSLDLQAEQQADWPVLKSHSENAAQLAMTDRTLEVTSVVTNSANYPSTHVATATALAGGFLTAGTETDPKLKIALNKQAVIINKDSGGNVKPKNLCVVMNPNTATLLANSQEVHSVFVRSQFALQNLKGEEPINAIWGLPDRLYGYPVVVEDTTYNTSNRGASGEAVTYVFPDNYIALLCREEQMEGVEGAHSYSTCHIFVYSPDDMKVEAKTDTWDRIIAGRVVDNRQVVQVAGVTGALITNVIS